jgi:hypothetical protein
MKSIHLIQPRTLRKRRKAALSMLRGMNGILLLTEKEYTALLIVAEERAFRDSHLKVAIANEKVRGDLMIDLRMEPDVWFLGNIVARGDESETVSNFLQAISNARTEDAGNALVPAGK